HGAFARRDRQGHAADSSVLRGDPIRSTRPPVHVLPDDDRRRGQRDERGAGDRGFESSEAEPVRLFGAAPGEIPADCGHHRRRIHRADESQPVRAAAFAAAALVLVSSSARAEGETFGLAIAIANKSSGDDAWLAEQVARANELFAAGGVQFRWTLEKPL